MPANENSKTPHVGRSGRGPAALFKPIHEGLGGRVGVEDRGAASCWIRAASATSKTRVTAGTPGAWRSTFAASSTRRIEAIMRFASRAPARCKVFSSEPSPRRHRMAAFCSCSITAGSSSTTRISCRAARSGLTTHIPAARSRAAGRGRAGCLRRVVVAAADADAAASA